MLFHIISYLIIIPAISVFYEMNFLGYSCLYVIDHGIETIEERVVKYKDENIEMSIKDDRKGINVEKIKEQAGILSGRGVGLAATRKEVERLNGNVKVITKADEGTGIKKCRFFRLQSFKI